MKTKYRNRKAIVVCIAAIIIGLYCILRGMTLSNTATVASEIIPAETEVIESSQEDENPEDETLEDENPEDEDQELLRLYRELNSDVVGIIRINDTVLNHALVQTPDVEDYYLYKDLTGAYNSHGVPFLSAASNIDATGENIVIYGHNICKNDRDVFCDLAYYEDLGFYKEHAYIETVSESGTRRWVIWAYFIVDNSDDPAFQYSDYTSFQSKASFQSFVSEVEKRNWLNTGIELNMGDTLITLSSCSVELSGTGTNRMVVVGKLITDGEDYESLIANATMSSSPLLPSKLQ